jgi:proline iminopeptidase
MRRTLGLVLALAGCLDPGESGNLVPRTVTEDPTLPAIDVAGTRFHAEAFGAPDAPILLTLHGGPGVDYRSMLPLAALADDGYRVVFWDQRGAGLSARHDADTYTTDTYLDDLEAVIAHYTVRADQPVVLIGHSWGAMYATALINERGDLGGRVRGMVLSEPGAFNEAQLRSFLDSLMGSIDFLGEQLDDAAWARAEMSASDHARADYLGSLFAYRGVPSEMHDPANPTPYWRYGAVVNEALLKVAYDTHFDWTTNLGAFHRHVLFLRGDLNTAATLEQQQTLAASYPDATIETITGVGHEMQYERADEYLAHVRAYLAAIGFVGGAR